MGRTSYDRLTALDNSFLLFESPTAYMHVASTAIFDAGPLRGPDGGIDAEAIKQMLGSSLHRIPRYRQKLAMVPFYDHAVWVDDDRFFLDYHVRHTALPKPGTDRQLKRLSARIMQQHLDRRRPLWEMWIVEGLEGDRFALIFKVHHCMVDGVSGVDLMRIMLSVSPEGHVHDPPPFLPREAPSSLTLLRDEMLRRAQLPCSLLRGTGRLMGEARDLRINLEARLRGITDTLGSAFQTASETPLNRAIGPHRRFDWFSMSLGDVKAIRRALGGSLNDVVLAIVTGAVRRFLRRRNVDLREVDFRVMVPVSVRSEHERGALGNRVSSWAVELPVSEPDPRQQLARISRRTEELKRSHNAIGADVLATMAEWTPSLVLSLAARNAHRVLPFNMVVTNVPGPQFPIYMHGAQMLEVFPHVPLLARLGLGIALMSYNGQLHWGFNADFDSLPDLHFFVDDVQAALEDLQASVTAIQLREAGSVYPTEAPASERGNGADASA